MTGPDKRDLPTNASLGEMRRARRKAARQARRLPKRIERRIRFAWVMLVWESLWPALWPAVGLTGFFIALALFGFFAGLPMGLHWAVLAGFGCLLGLALWRGFRGFLWPDRTAALRHLEAASGFSHQPLAAYEDNPAEGTGDPTLWLAHQRWVNERLLKLKTGIASPGLAARDPHGLRAAVALLIVIGLAGTGSGQLRRIAAALLPGAGTSRNFSLEAWITPPAYTGLAPIYLEGQGSTVAQKGGMDETLRKVPVGSVLSLRVHGLRTAPALEAGIGDRGRPEPLKDMGEANYALDAPIVASAEFSLTQGGRLMRGWRIEATPDTPPTVTLAKPLRETATGTLDFAYKVHDDYGVVTAEARIALASPPPAKPQPGGLAALQPKPVVSPPVVTLPLPLVRPRDASDETYVDLRPHPWAGLPVTITLVAKDDAGNEGLSAPVSLTLPAREFTKPLAAAIVEQRRALALDPAQTMRVARIVDDLTADGDRYIPDKTVYLGLRSVYWRLIDARRDADFTGIFDLMWKIALRIEDGDLSLAESDVRRARDALSQALAKDAGADEIERLMSELRQAFQRYMDALAAKGAPAPSALDKMMPPSGLTIDRSQLEKMMDAIGELARTGARAQAQAMLQQLQSIMENMQVPNQRPGMTEDEQAMAGAVDSIGKLIDKERQLMDKTFREGAKSMAGSGAEGTGATPGRNGRQGGKPSTLQALKHAQEALRGELEEVMRDLGKAGVKTPSGLGKAQDSMQSAEDRLGNGRTDTATASQGQAIEGMRDAAQGLADRLMQSMTGRRSGTGNGNAQTDPLGRPLPNAGLDLGADVAVPDKIDIQRAREIIEELRRRASELGRPKIELDYLDRLLKRF